jgi:hypothetical protein
MDCTMTTPISRVLALTEELILSDICCKDLSEASRGQGIAKEIVSQIRSLNKWAMGSWGANQLVALEDGLQFKVKGSKIKVGGRVQIRLKSNDLYDVRLLRVRGADVKEIASAEGIYNDSLVEILDNMIG